MVYDEDLDTKSTPIMALCKEEPQDLYQLEWIIRKIAALVAGFIGSDIATTITKRVGLTKGLEIRLTDKQVALSEFNPR